MSGSHIIGCNSWSCFKITFCVITIIFLILIITKTPQRHIHRNLSHGLLLYEKVDNAPEIDQDYKTIIKNEWKLLARSGSSCKFARANFLTSEGYVPNTTIASSEEDLLIVEDVQEYQSSNYSVELPHEDGRQIFANGLVSCEQAFRDWTPSMEDFFWDKVRQCNKNALCCILPAPKNYILPYKWPRSKTQVRIQNIPRVPLLHSSLADSGMKVHKGIISFPQTGLRFPTNISKYVKLLYQLVPKLEFGIKTRLVLDLDSRAGNLGIELEKHGVLTLAIKAKNSPKNGIQLILERGYVGLLHDLATKRLPFPSQAFDLLHCAPCDIPWFAEDEILFSEADRLLRAGGFFVWLDGPETDTMLSGMLRLTTSLCWKLLLTEQRLSIWQKHTNTTCQVRNQNTAVPHFFEEQVSTKNVLLDRCSINPEEWGTQNWPDRLVYPPLRLQCAPSAGLIRAKAEVFEADTSFWRENTNVYLRTLGQSRISDIRNVLDMNGGYGGFSAAITLAKPSVPWWVLNVIPIDGPDRLAVIFDRGLIGVYHDWCTALDAYPRTFDMIHASRLFSAEHKCQMIDILLEMDRLLRPGGFAIIHDGKETLQQIKTIANLLHWKAALGDTESGPMGYNKVLYCEKTFWQPTFDTHG
ncbi:hypothetical protein O6H91_05G116000 [Diphasiastrum complanatum]|uniref:Uncharacterized protein n=1 Tax=Diphasiastrum complanatum TaxID=34168 RepID=A0ACC2DSW4_DIPCM|nr:hypothetical protein O6H91_05G116000 [Diphasiastrum complanatum]